MTRPVGQRPESERSDWTETDLLTKEEASGRIEQEITEARAALEQTTDEAEKDGLERRIRAMEVSRERFEG